MKTAHKPCKGINKAKDFEGCGEMVLQKSRRYGLCTKCFTVWVRSTEAGGEWLRNNLIPKARKISHKKRRAEKKELRLDHMSVNEYRSKYVQPKINKIARLIDYGQPCIATGNFGKMNGGHFYSVGSNSTLSLNLHNIHVQSYASNTYKGGDERRYLEGLKRVYGEGYAEFVQTLPQHKALKLLKSELRHVKRKAEKIIKELEHKKQVYRPAERIHLRNAINVKLGLYDLKASVYGRT